MELFYRQYSSEGPPLIILHGLFGNHANWAWHAKALAEDYAVWSFDLRNHGSSSWHDEHNYQVLAQDVFDTVKQLNLEKVSLLGHSMGGKTAMRCALDFPTLVDRLVVVDISPVTYSSAVSEYLPLRAMHAVDLSTIENRRQASDAMLEVLDDEGLMSFLLTNLKRDQAGQFSWRCNLQAITEQFDQISAWPEHEKVFNHSTLFIKGADSDYIQASYRAEIERYFPAAELKIINQAGHWAHGDKPDAVLKVIQDFLA